MIQAFRNKKLIPFAAFLIIFTVAWAAGQTGVPVEDGGEFLTVARLGGVNHPPGLPLLGQLCRISWIFFGPHGLRILFALFAATALTLLGGLRSIGSFILSLALLLLPAFHGRLLMWDAYSPLFLIFALALLRKPGLCLEGGYLTGLALAVHPQGILLPILMRWKRPRPLQFLSGLVLGLSLYLALPISSGAGSIMDWGSTGTVTNFLKQVTAGGYREVYGASMGSLSLTSLMRYLGTIWSMLWPVLLLPVMVGGAVVFRDEKWLCRRLSLLLLADLVFVIVINPMAAGTTQTAILSLLVVTVLAFKGLKTIAQLNCKAGLALAILVLATAVLTFQPLKDQTEEVEDLFAQAPLNSVLYISSNDLLYGGWTLKYAHDRRPDLVLLSTGNFAGWFEDMAVSFNPDIDLSAGVLDVGDYTMSREVLAQLLIQAAIEDNPQRTIYLIERP